LPDFDQVTPESIFTSNVTEAEAVTLVEKPPSTLVSFYTEDDSDNPSEEDDFKPIYRQEKDDYSDLT
jgi:hypothetical protein